MLMRRPKKLQVFANFLPSWVKTLYNPPNYPYISPPDYVLFQKLKIKIKGLHFADVAEIQEAVSDELKKTRNEKLSTAFQKLYDHEKAYICQWSLF
jgi:hypothetical protein